MTTNTMFALLVAGLTSASTAAVPKTAKSKARPTPSTTKGATKTNGATKASTRPAARRPRARAASRRGARGKIGPKVRFEIGVQFTRTADDDGGSASTLTRANAEAAIKRANAVWARRGGDIRFHVHPASNFDTLLRNTALNQDCDYQPGWSANTVSQATNGDLDGDGKDGKDSDVEVICGATAKLTRSAYGVARANRIVVISRGGNKRVQWNAAEDHWETVDDGAGASSPASYFIRMPPNFGGSTSLAHELGHYLPAGHPFSHRPKTIAQARKLMEDYAARHPGADPAGVFDRDRLREPPNFDTPPDPGSGLWHAAHGDECDPSATSLSIDVTVAGRTRAVVLAPDRKLVMSYFKNCDFDHYISPGQYARVRQSLHHGNRQALAGPTDNSCYATGWQPGDPVASEADLASLIRDVARCALLAGDRAPWEFGGKEIYVNPSEVAGRRGFRKRGGLGINGVRERAMVGEMVHAPMVE